MISEYWRVRGDKEHMLRRQRFNYLQAKLQHIKQLIAIFEHEERVSSVGPANVDEMPLMHNITANNNNNSIDTENIDDRY
jgi:hypothetical protein